MGTVRIGNVAKLHRSIINTGGARTLVSGKEVSYTGLFEENQIMRFAQEWHVIDNVTDQK